MNNNYGKLLKNCKAKSQTCCIGSIGGDSSLVLPDKWLISPGDSVIVSFWKPEQFKNDNFLKLGRICIA